MYIGSKNQYDSIWSLNFALGNEIQIFSYFASFNTQPKALKCKKLQLDDCCFEVFSAIKTSMC